MSIVAVANFGTGNLWSVRKAVERAAGRHIKVIVTDRKSELEQADRVVFPGQGAIGTCLSSLDEHGLRETMVNLLKSKPLLGICLGLQAMYEFSEEDGGAKCLGVLNGRVRHLGDTNTGGRPSQSDAVHRLKVPHMGWNNVTQTQPHPLWRDIECGQRFYFVHSYCVQASDPVQVYGATEYGDTFTSAGGKENFFGVQFHPEKSQHAGLTLMRNFVEWDGSV